MGNRMEGELVIDSIQKDKQKPVESGANFPISIYSVGAINQSI